MRWEWTAGVSAHFTKFYVREMNGPIIALVEDEGHARLIAAAPDLLEALKAQEFSEMTNRMYGEAIARHGHSSDQAEFAWKTAMSAGLKAKELRDAAILRAEGGEA